MGARGQLKAREYDWERIAQRVLDYYLRVLSEPPWNRRLPESENMSPAAQQKDGR